MSQKLAAYVNARVRGMKSHLLSTGDLDHLLSSGDEESMVQQLLTSAYEGELAESLTRYAGADAVEDAASRNLVHTFAKLNRACTGDYGQLAGIFIARWDLTAVKSLLRNRHHGLDDSTGEASTVPSPTMSAALQSELGSLDTMDALVRGLTAWNSKLCRPLLDAIGSYQESNDLRVLEEALDRNYFVGNVRRLQSSKSDDATFIRDVLRFEIDRINLRRIFEPRTPGTEVEDVLMQMLPQGTLPASLLRDIALAGSTERAGELLSKTAYAELGDALAGLAESAQFSYLERRFEQVLLKKLKRAAQQQGLGLAVLLRYAWLKYNEVINLRMIARGKAAHLPEDRVRQELVYV